MPSHAGVLLTYHSRRPFPRKSPYPAGIRPVCRAYPEHTHDYFQRIHRFAALIALFIYLSIAADLNLQPLGKSIYNRCAYAVQTAGYLVSAAAELAARMQDRKYDLNRRKSGFFLSINRDTTTVILSVMELSALICTSM